MKLQSLFAYFLLSCASFASAGDEKSTSKNLPELPNSAHEILLTPDLSSDQPTSSSLVYFGNDGRLVYKPYTDKGDQILDFSICGYKRSEEPIPNVAVVATVNPLQGEATPDGTMAYPKGPDSREQIQSALDRVASRQPDKDGFRGTVLLKKGTYYVNGNLLVRSGVVLRGEGDGPEGTVLIFRNPRGTGIQVGNPEAKPVSMGEPTKITDDYIPAGSMHVNVEDARQFKQGDYIHVRKITNDKWIKDLGMDRITEIRPDNKRVGNWNARAYQFDHVRQITQIEGNMITLDVQLPQSITAEHGGGTVEKISLDEIDSLCGVESLRILSNYDTSVKSVRDNIEYFSDEDNNLRSGINLTCINGWTRDCTVKHTRNAAVMVSDPARYCTIRDCKKLEPVAPILGGRRYPFSFNGGSHSLFYNCYTEEARHAFAAGSRVNGPNAFVQCTAWKSSTISEPHHRWSTGLLYDNITLKEGGQLGALNRGYSGSGHGWAGANIVFWNCDAESVVVFDPPTPEQNFAIGYTGEIRDEYSTERLEYANDRSGYAGTPKAGVYKGFALMGTGYIENPEGPVAPQSLFMQQLIDRIGSERAAQVMSGTGNAQTYARFVPERKDDFAWENDLIAFRAYGPALRESTENSGIDAWLKRVDYPIINKWYREAEAGKSYHKDHGEGLDNYQVGSSAGCGGTGIWLNGEREPLETFTNYKVIEVSPERSRFKLIYEREIDGVVYGEEKTITIESGKRLFQVESVFLKDKQPAANLPICVGLTTHDGKAEAFFNQDEGWIATWESLGDSELGTGARMDPAQLDSIVMVDRKTKDASHIFLIAKTDSEGRISYEAGYGWKKAREITTREAWSNYLSNE